MSISITPLSAERLRVTGDIAVDLAIPYDAADDRFHLAVSDDTLIAGEYDPEAGGFHYLVETEGAGFIGIERDRLTLEGAVGWVTIGRYNPALGATAGPAPLPLFESMAQPLDA